MGCRSPQSAGVYRGSVAGGDGRQTSKEVGSVEWVVYPNDSLKENQRRVFRLCWGMKMKLAGIRHSQVHCGWNKSKAKA